MKAIVVKETGEPEVLELQEIERPKAAADQVLIQVEAISVNFADIKARQGQYHGVAADLLLRRVWIVQEWSWKPEQM